MEPKILSSDTWKSLAAGGSIPRDVALRKAYVADEVKSLDDADRTVRIVISTAAVDREGDTVNPQGWKIDNYLKNPVVLWAHDYHALPLARNKALSVEDGKLVATAQFAEAELNPLAETVYQMLKRGFLNAASVGFLPLTWKESDDENRKPRRGVDFLEQELLEYSIVPVPANPEALVEARSLGVNIDPLKRWAEEILDSYHQDRGLYLPRREVEKILHIVAQKELVAVDGLKAKTVPSDVSTETAPEDTAWERPRLEDFTSESWDDLSDAEKRRIAGHFAWARTMPPEAFGDLKLPHHRPSDGAVVWNGVRAAMAALLGARGGVDIPEGDRRAVYNHLARHYRQFDKEPPDFRLVEQQILAGLVEALDEAERQEARAIVPVSDPWREIAEAIERLSGSNNEQSHVAQVIAPELVAELWYRELQQMIDEAIKRATCAVTGKLPD